MTLNNSNYYSLEMTNQFWSVSQFKTFDRCEAMGLAEVRGIYERELSDALLIGSYVDAYFSGEMTEFEEQYGHLMFKRGGEIKAKFRNAGKMIERVRRDPLMMEYLSGEKQTIMAARLFGVPWKAKFDVYNETRIVDLKTVKDFEDIYDPSKGGRVSWIEYWGYDIQGAIYQRIEQAVTGRTEPLPFYIAAVTKEKVPDIKVIKIPQHILDTAFQLVEAKIDRFDLIKSGDVEPIRCEHCDFCKATKRLEEPEVYEIREGM